LWYNEELTEEGLFSFSGRRSSTCFPTMWREFFTLLRPVWRSKETWSIDIDTTVQEEDGSIGERSFAVEMVLYNVPEQSKHVEEKHESVCGWSGY
jgi:hypothetical protein